MKLPQSTAQLHQIHGLFGKQLRLYANDILRIVAEAKSAPEDALVEKPQRLIDFSAHKRASADIKSLVEKISEQSGIPSPVLASKKQIAQVLKWCWFSLDETELQGLRPDLLSGWRRELFIEELMQLFGDKGKYETLRSL